MKAWAERLRVAAPRRQHQLAAPRRHAHQVAVGQVQARHVLRAQVDRRLGHVAEQPAQRAGAAHAVPLVAQAAGGRARTDSARRAARPAACASASKKRARPSARREAAVGVEPRPAARRACRKRPLLRAVALDQRVAQAGDVEVAAARGLAMLVPDRLGRRRRRTATARPGRSRASTRRATSTTMRQSSRASPAAGTAARTRLMRRSLLVTVPSLLAPGRRGQQQVGEGARSRSSRRPPAARRTRRARARAARSPGRASTAPGSCRRSTAA